MGLADAGCGRDVYRRCYTDGRLRHGAGKRRGGRADVGVRNVCGAFRVFQEVVLIEPFKKSAPGPWGGQILGRYCRARAQNIEDRGTFWHDFAWVT